MSNAIRLIRAAEEDLHIVPVIDKREISVPLRSGGLLFVNCSPGGLIFAADFVTEDGGVVRLEERLTEGLTGLVPATDVVSLIGQSDAEDIRLNKAIAVDALRRLPMGERILVLRRAASIDEKRSHG